MFKKYHVESKLVKDDATQEEKPKLTPNDFIPLMRETVQNVAAGATVLTVAYVGADTIRRVFVHIVATKIN